jgi:antitoxin (DNA-binding transcriptional repressor) of toxin-antitoxin stability system
MTIIDQLRPGIHLTFERLGYKVEVAQARGQVEVTLTKDGETEVRLFPMPSKNRDISAPLLLWRDEKKEEQEKKLKAAKP